MYMKENLYTVFENTMRFYHTVNSLFYSLNLKAKTAINVFSNGLESATVAEFPLRPIIYFTK